MDMSKAGKNADCYTLLEKHEEWIEEWYEEDPDANEKRYFYSYLLQNSKQFLNFTKRSTKFGEFQKFIGFFKIFLDCHVFFFIL